MRDISEQFQPGWNRAAELVPVPASDTQLILFFKNIFVVLCCCFIFYWLNLCKIYKIFQPESLVANACNEMWSADKYASSVEQHYCLTMRAAISNLWTEYDFFSFSNVLLLFLYLCIFVVSYFQISLNKKKGIWIQKHEIGPTQSCPVKGRAIQECCPFSDKWFYPSRS